VKVFLKRVDVRYEVLETHIGARLSVYKDVKAIACWPIIHSIQARGTLSQRSRCSSSSKLRPDDFNQRHAPT
jgi:hypothetical protein